MTWAFRGSLDSTSAWGKLFRSPMNKAARASPGPLRSELALQRPMDSLELQPNSRGQIFFSHIGIQKSWRFSVTELPRARKLAKVANPPPPLHDRVPSASGDSAEMDWLPVHWLVAAAFIGGTLIGYCFRAFLSARRRASARRRRHNFE